MSPSSPIPKSKELLFFRSCGWGYSLTGSMRVPGIRMANVISALHLPKFVSIFIEGSETTVMQETESRLIERLRESDQDAFRLLFEKYQPILFRNVLYTLQDVDITHDVVQETFVRVWNRRALLQPHLPLLGYLFRISRNLILDLAKHKAVQKKLEADVPLALQTSEDDPVDALHLRMLEERVAEVIRTKLPTKCREVFLLSRVEELTNGEISRHLGISVKTVENQITRGLKILRRHLGQYV